MATIYDLVTLAGVSSQIKVAPRFWLDHFYKKQINFDTDWIQFDKVFGDTRKLAPFVAPNVAGRPQRLQGFSTERFKPAYTKQKDVVDYTMHITRVAGEALGGTLSIEQRRQAVKAYLLMMQKEKVQNTNNWLAARATIDAAVTIKGEDYPEVTLDFQRHANLSSTLTGGARWTETTADPLQDIQDMRVEANGRSGARIQEYIFGANAWNLFTKRVDLKDMMDKNYAGQPQITGLNRIAALNDAYPDGVEFVGRISSATGQGTMDCWVDTTRYVDPVTGAEVFYLDQDTVVGVGAMMEGTRCFGAIMDIDAGFVAMESFYKNWITPDPSQEWLLTQSAPLMVPREPNATFKLKVTNAS